MEIVLVGVNADRQCASVSRGLQHAEARSARRRIDDIGALGHLALGDFATLYRIVPGGTGVAGHVLEDDGVGTCRLYTLHIAAGEFVDQRNVHAAHEADLAGLRRHAGHHADEIGAFLLLEHQGLHIGQIDHVVDDGKLEVGIFGGDLLHRFFLGEARRDDRAIALVGEIADRLFALGLVGDFEFAVGGARFSLELFRRRCTCFR